MTPEEIALNQGLPKTGLGVGCNSDMRTLVGDSVLTSALFDWFPVFNYFVSNLLDGT